MADHVLGIEDFNVGRRFHIASLHGARAVLLQDDALDAVRMDAQRDFLDVEDHVGHVFAHARDGRELVQHAVDLHGFDGSALQRRQQDAAQRITERHAKAAFQRLRDNSCDAVAVAAGLDIDFRWLDQVLPVLLENVHHGGPRLWMSRGRNFWDLGPRIAERQSWFVQLAHTGPNGPTCAGRKTITRDGAFLDGNHCAESA